MNKIVKRVIVLVLTALVVIGSIPAATVYAADKEVAHTDVTTSGKGDKLKVTYTFSLDKVNVTDGRVAVFYDPAALTLNSDSEKGGFAESDVNKEITDGDYKGLSFAFVNDAPKSVKGDIVTLKFNAVKGAPYGDYVIRTVIYSLNNEDEVILANEVLEDTVTVGVGDLKKPNLKSLDQTLIGVNVVWDKDANADGYIVYRSSSENGTYTTVGTSSGSSFWDILVLNNHTYYYKIRSYQGSGKNRVYSDYSDVLSIKVAKFKIR